MYIIKKTEFDRLENRIKDAVCISIVGYIDTSDKNVVESWINDTYKDINKYKGWDNVYYPFYTYEEISSVQKIENDKNAEKLDSLRDISSCVSKEEDYPVMVTINTISEFNDTPMEYRKCTINNTKDFSELMKEMHNFVIDTKNNLNTHERISGVYVYGHISLSKILPIDVYWTESVGSVVLDYRKATIRYQGQEYDIILSDKWNPNPIYV